MKIQDIMKKVEEADLKPKEAELFLAFLTGYLGDDNQDYNLEQVVKAFENALVSRLNSRNEDK